MKNPLQYRHGHQRVVEGGEGVTSIDGVFHNTYIQYFEELQYFTGIDCIPEYAFSGCQKLRKVILPPNIVTLEQGAFYNALSLLDISIPEGVTTLGRICFYGCEELSKISLPNSLIKIGDRCFYKCYALESLVIPDSNA
ncbi:MAG: leucine-rich repeat domain-containing protein [Candidatus Cryptobacteroides sp.]